MMKKWSTLVTMALAMFIIVIDTTIMNVSISALVVDLNTTVSGVQAAISIYAMVMLLVHWEEYLEKHGRDGLFPPSIFKSPGLKSGISARFVQMAVMAGFLYVFPLMLQLSFNFTAMQTGLALMPFSLSLYEPNYQPSQLYSYQR